MKVAVFVSEYRCNLNPLEYIPAEKLGFILVGNGVYHAVLKENYQDSPILQQKGDFYVLLEDLETRGCETDCINPKVKPVTYDDLVDLIFYEYEKLMWLQ